MVRESHRTARVRGHGFPSICAVEFLVAQAGADDQSARDCHLALRHDSAQDVTRQTGSYSAKALLVPLRSSIFRDTAGAQ